MVTQALSAQSLYTRVQDLPGFTSTVLLKGVGIKDLYTWLNTMDNNQFQAWHPLHQEYRVIKRTDSIIGNRIYFDETIAGFRINWTWKVVYAHPPDTTIFKRAGLPVYWSVILIKTESGTKVINDMRFGVGWDWFDKFMQKVVERWYLTPGIQKAIIQHDQEEFRLLEKKLKVKMGFQL